MSRMERDLLLRDVAEGLELCAPDVGQWQRQVEVGDLLRAGQILGSLERLGQRVLLRVPKGGRGAVVSVRGDEARDVPVGFGTALVVVDPSLAGVEVASSSAGADEESGAPVFRFPMGGRYYAQPQPGADPFVRVGDTVAEGQTVGLLEVMKTFHRLIYAPGEGLPERGKVVALRCQDGDDVSAGQALFEVEPS